MTDVILPTQARGRARFWTSPLSLYTPLGYHPWDHGWANPRAWNCNTILYQWGTILSKLLTTGDQRYRIAGMYLEFENVGSPGDPVSPPGYDRTRGIDYYISTLSGNPDRDYLRVALTASMTASSDDELFPGGNIATFFARSDGVAGVLGRPFSHVNNSTIYGASLVAMPTVADPSQDLLLSTIYWDEDQQQPKLSTSQVGVEWEVQLN
jgi:hypothetical protein